MAGKKDKGGDEGAPMWIVTFSDLMSLLLTFFVLLLSFSTITEEEFNEAMMSLQGALGVMPQFTSVIDQSQRRSRGAKEDSQKAARQLRRMLQVKGLEKQVKIEYDAFGGLKISLPNAVLFEPGSATLQPDAYPLMEDMGEVLGEMPETFIEVRGHTDSSPLNTASSFRDNYDLSYFRAYEVANRLAQAGGIPREQFEMVACGSSQPMASNETESGRMANRRVEIYVRGLVDAQRLRGLESGDYGEAAEPNRVIDPIAPAELDGLR
ncbi:MAG: OmpA family protein [Candidatus Hydrogenedens sp.]|nr:OmpA family protein [Candidatus Hydrogenedens sp.]